MLVRSVIQAKKKAVDKALQQARKRSKFDHKVQKIAWKILIARMLEGGASVNSYIAEEAAESDVKNSGAQESANGDRTQSETPVKVKDSADRQEVGERNRADSEVYRKESGEGTVPQP